MRRHKPLTQPERAFVAGALNMLMQEAEDRNITTPEWRKIIKKAMRLAPGAYADFRNAYDTWRTADDEHHI